MKYDCDMICDLLPLYIDDACSEASAKAVEEHLAECESCTSLYNDMKKAETDIGQEIKEIQKERDNVIRSQAKMFKRRSAFAGGIIGAIFGIPILICLIVNLSTGAGLTWFFIVLAAMFIPASLTVVPLMAPTRKALCTAGSFFISLLTLLGVCCIYTGGDWFLIPASGILILASLIVTPLLVRKDKGLWTLTAFVASLLLLFAVCNINSGGNWFFAAASGTIFGLTLIFAPSIVKSPVIAKRIGDHKGLVIVIAYTVTYLLMMFSIGITVKDEDYTRIAFAYSVPALSYLWCMYLVLSRRKWNGLLKVAAAILVSSLFFFFSDTIIILLLGRGFWFPKFDFTSMDAASIEQSVSWTVLIVGTVVAVVMGALGIYRQKKNNNTNEK